MSRGVQLWLFGSFAAAALAALAGCSHSFYSGERETWRREAEASCINSGTVKEGPERVRISAISGPGMCGADFPIRVSALGDAGPLGYDDEPVRPPGSVPSSAAPQHWPVVQSSTLPPPQSAAPQYGSQQYGSPQNAPSRPSPAPPAQPGPMQATASVPGRPMSLYPPGVPDPSEDDAAFEPAPPQPYGGTPGPRSSVPPAAAYPPRAYPPPTYTPRAPPPPPAVEEHVPLGWPRNPAVTASVGPVEVKPAATLACPIVAALDQWITTAVQPAAQRWFHVPVVEIKQISAYSCRGMNGNPYAHISEHAFGNALDIAEFTLADGHRVTVQYGWRGSPEEQGFLHDVQLAACNEFSTVLAPGANVYHYNHIHVDLMRRSSGRRICQPEAIPGEVVAERARAQYASHRDGDWGVTGSIKKRIKRALGYAAEDDDKLPVAVPGED
jgi:Extensin-like protein C-terminus